MAALTQYAALAVLLVPTVGSVAWTATDREPCLKILSTDLKTPTVKVGELLTIDYQISTRDGCRATAERVMLDGANIPVPLTADPSFVSGQAATDYTKATALMIPRAVPGNAQLRMTLSMSGNWFQRTWPVIVVQKDVNFTVIAQGTPSG